MLFIALDLSRVHFRPLYEYIHNLEASVERDRTIDQLVS